MTQASFAVAPHATGAVPLTRDEGRRPYVARVQGFGDLASVAKTWSALEVEAPGSAYQTRRWLVPWAETVGVAAGVEPHVFVAFDEADRPVALLPFGLWRRGPLRVAGFLGGKDSNFNMGLFRPGLAWAEDDVRTLFARSAAAAHGRIDAFVLRNQPLAWRGRANPLAALPRQPSPSFGYKAALAADPDAFFHAALSKDGRKKLRQKTRRLREVGPVEHRVARTGPEIAVLLDALLGQKAARDAALGLAGVGDPALRRFLERAAVPTGDDAPAVELHALACGDALVASFVGARHQDRFSGMLMCFAADPAVARWSPGELLLASVIRAKCLEGCAEFDLGVGEGRYKQAYCPVVEPLFDCFVPVTAAGRVLAVGERLRLKAKRAIKQSAWAWPMVQSVRRATRSVASRGVAHRL